MAFASKQTQLMAAGMAAGAASAVNGGKPSTGISAAGTTRATATTLTVPVNLVGTAAANSGVALPNWDVGDSVYIYNDATGNSFYVYPDGSANTINQIGAGNGMLLANNTGCFFQKVTSSRWVANLSA